MSKLAYAMIALVWVAVGVAQDSWPVNGAGRGVWLPGPNLPTHTSYASTIQDMAGREQATGFDTPVESEPLPATYRQNVETSEEAWPSWTMAAALKTAEGNTSVGSNPTASATFLQTVDNSEEAEHGMVAARGDSGSDSDTGGPVGPGGYVRAVGAGRPGTVLTGELTWVHPSLAGGVMRDGHTVFQPTSSGVVAANSWPLGTELILTGPTGRSISVVVSDTGKLGPRHIDASQSDFAVIAGGLDAGRIAIEIREVQP